MCSDNNTAMLVQPASVNSNSGGMGWGGDWASWIIVFLIFAMFGWGGYGGFGGGFGGNSVNGALTRGDLCMDMNFNDLQNAVRSSAAESNSNFRGVDNAICQLGYQTAQLANGIQNSVDGGFARLDTSLCQSVNNISQQLNGINVGIMQSQNALQSQLANCCCDVREGISGLNYNNAMNTAAIQNTINSVGCEAEKIAMQSRFDAQQYNCGTLQAIDKLGDRIIDYMAAQNAQQLRDENQALRLAASQQAQNNYLVNQLKPCPIPAYITCNPYAASYGVGFGCNCN